MDRYERLGLGSIILFICIIIGFICGWVMNIVGLVSMLGDPSLTPMFIARCVGVFVAPLGAVLGYF